MASKLDKEAERITSTTCLYMRLGVPTDSSLTHIMRTHRTLAKAWHPDRCKHPQATNVMACLNIAYNTLTDEKARKLYDLVNGHNKVCLLCNGTGKVRRAKGFKTMEVSCECTANAGA